MLKPHLCERRCTRTLLPECFRPRRAPSRSRRFAKLDDGQVSSAFHIAHYERQPRSTLTSDPSLRRGTRPSARPVPARFVSRLDIRRLKIRVDLPRRSPAEGLIGAVVVVPDGIRNDLVPHGVQLQRNSNGPRTLGLHRTYETLDGCNTSLLADGTEPRTDTSTVTPPPKGVAPELAAFVGNDISGSITHVTDRSF